MPGNGSKSSRRGRAPKGVRTASYRRGGGGNRGGVRMPFVRTAFGRSTGSSVIRSDMSAGVAPVENIRSLPLFPEFVKSTLTYSTYISITSSAVVGVTGWYIFAANGLFDPDITSTGHQPTGFDQMMVFFEHYTVYNARIRVLGRNDSTTVPNTLCVYNSADNTPATIYEEIKENGNLSAVILNCANNFGCQASIKRSINVSRALGIPDLQSMSEARGTGGSNPTEVTYFAVGATNQSSNAAIALEADVFIEFDAVFSERRDAIESLKRQLSFPDRYHANEERRKLRHGRILSNVKITEESKFPMTSLEETFVTLSVADKSQAVQVKCAPV